MSDTVHGQVLDIVRSVLRLDTYETTWDFFDLGADSLAVVRIVERVREECGADVWITDAFDAPDVDSFACLAAERAAALPDAAAHPGTAALPDAGARAEGGRP
ncbi:acyl carrier protein [Streptomyces sp. URMC 123]|uniref:acyl carrier protein n=1 Tax=Streptomyces sp. URMC 123 TaxID=3423403 RepID=UPI003F1B122B